MVHNSSDTRQKTREANTSDVSVIDRKKTHAKITANSKPSYRTCQAAILPIFESAFFMIR
jgi:hypothetical protein